MVTKFCPFRLINPSAGSIGGLCIGPLCAWFVEGEDKCVVSPCSMAKPASQPEVTPDPVPEEKLAAKRRTTRAKNKTEG